MNRALAAKAARATKERREVAIQHALHEMEQGRESKDHSRYTTGVYASIAGVRVNATLKRGTKCYRHRTLLRESETGKQIQELRSQRVWANVSAVIRSSNKVGKRVKRAPKRDKCTIWYTAIFGCSPRLHMEGTRVQCLYELNRLACTAESGQTRAELVNV